MRRFLLLLALLAVLPAVAQQPPKLMPLPEPPPLPAGAATDESTEPQVTITKRGDDKVEEYRVNNKLYMIRVTPGGGGPAYYLVDLKGDGGWERRDSLDSGLHVPMWVIHSF
jgi:hypothetical protein